MRQFEKNQKLTARFIGPFSILEHIGRVSYHQQLPHQLVGGHDVFHLSMLMKHVREKDRAKITEDLSELDIQ